MLWLSTAELVTPAGHNGRIQENCVFVSRGRRRAAQPASVVTAGSSKGGRGGGRGGGGANTDCSAYFSSDSQIENILLVKTCILCFHNTY